MFSITLAGVRVEVLVAVGMFFIAFDRVCVGVLVEVGTVHPIRKNIKLKLIADNILFIVIFLSSRKTSVI
jgi:hypothetical protein